MHLHLFSLDLRCELAILQDFAVNFSQLRIVPFYIIVVLLSPEPSLALGLILYGRSDIENSRYLGYRIASCNIGIRLFKILYAVLSRFFLLAEWGLVFRKACNDAYR